MKNKSIKKILAILSIVSITNCTDAYAFDTSNIKWTDDINYTKNNTVYYYENISHEINVKDEFKANINYLKDITEEVLTEEQKKNLNVNKAILVNYSYTNTSRHVLRIIELSPFVGNSTTGDNININANTIDESITDGGKSSYSKYYNSKNGETKTKSDILLIPNGYDEVFLDAKIGGSLGYGYSAWYFNINDVK